MKFLKLCVLVSLIFFLGGCTYNLRKFPVEEGTISDIRSELPINLINDQTLGVVKIVNGGGDKINLKNTTDLAIDIFKDELSKKNVIFTNNTDRYLKVKVEKIIINIGFWVSKCTAFLSIETGDGFKEIFDQYARSGLSPIIACEYALPRVVAKSLNNDFIRNYIIDGSSSKLSNKERLVELNQLLELGLITEEEYERKKEAILGNL